MKLSYPPTCNLAMVHVIYRYFFFFFYNFGFYYDYLLNTFTIKYIVVNPCLSFYFLDTDLVITVFFSAGLLKTAHHKDAKNTTEDDRPSKFTQYHFRSFLLLFSACMHLKNIKQWSWKKIHGGDLINIAILWTTTFNVNFKMSFNF